MNNASEATYYLRRERAARALAAKAADPHIARIHHDMAKLYGVAASAATDIDTRSSPEGQDP